MSDPSAGTIGGIFAGIVAMLVALGHALKWWLGWTDGRALTRTKKLDAWQTELQARENRFDERQAEYQARIECELTRLRAEHSAMYLAYQLVATEMRTIHPHNEALRRADELMRTAFPLEATLPPFGAAAIARLNDTD